MTCALATLLLLPVLATAQPRIRTDAFTPLIGNWKGELVYMDYSTGSETHIPANLTVEALEDRTCWLVFGYPDEPGSNDGDTLVHSADGRLLDGMQVIAVDPLENGTLRITLEQDGEDDNAPARIRKLWTIGPNTCILRKEVRLMDGSAYRLRHEYRSRGEVRPDRPPMRGLPVVTTTRPRSAGRAGLRTPGQATVRTGTGKPDRHPCGGGDKAGLSYSLVD